jgi:hypothetical protein
LRLWYHPFLSVNTINMAFLTEADTCRRYVLPKLYAAGWNDEQISEQKSFTDGRIVVAGSNVKRRPQKRLDYLLRYRRDFPIGKRVRPLLPPQVCTRALATKANGIVAVWLSCQLENGNPDAAPALGVVLTGWRDVLFFAFANCKYRRRNFATYREHHSRSKGRDCEIESGAPVVGGHKHNREEISTKKCGTTETQNVSGGQEKNRSGTASTLGKNQGSKKGVVRPLCRSPRQRPVKSLCQGVRSEQRSNLFAGVSGFDGLWRTTCPHEPEGELGKLVMPFEFRVNSGFTLVAARF